MTFSVHSAVTQAIRSLRVAKAESRQEHTEDHLRHWKQSRRLWKQETAAMRRLLEQRLQEEVRHPTSLHAPLPSALAGKVKPRRSSGSAGPRQSQSGMGTSSVATSNDGLDDGGSVSLGFDL